MTHLHDVIHGDACALRQSVMAVLDPVVEQLRAVQRRQLVVERGGRVVGVTHAALRAHIAARLESLSLLGSRICEIKCDYFYS